MDNGLCVQSFRSFDIHSSVKFSPRSFEICVQDGCHQVSLRSDCSVVRLFLQPPPVPKFSTRNVINVFLIERSQKNNNSTTTNILCCLSMMLVSRKPGTLFLERPVGPRLTSTISTTLWNKIQSAIRFASNEKASITPSLPHSLTSKGKEICKSTGVHWTGSRWFGIPSNHSAPFSS